MLAEQGMTQPFQEEGNLSARKGKRKKTQRLQNEPIIQQENSPVNEGSMRIGILIPLGEIEQLGSPLTYAEIKDQAQQGEALGFDSLWVYDHLFHRFSGKQTVGFRESWTILSALAEATKQPELGTQVLSTSFRNPALLAKMADTLEEVSNGRLILGLGAGWHQPEFDAFGFPFDHLASRFEEALQIIIPLLRDGHVDFSGKYYQAKDCELRPHATRRSGGPPVTVASFGPRMLRLTARYANGWSTDWLGSEEHLSKRREALEAACSEVGRDPKTLTITGGVTIAYPELGNLLSWMTNPNQYLSGSSEEIADAFRNYANLSVSHVICSYYPSTPEALEKLGEAVKSFRASQP